MDIHDLCVECCEVERDRLTAGEICVDEVLTIMDRHGLSDKDLVYRAMKQLSGVLHSALTSADGAEKRRDRIIRVRDALTDAMPMSDADLKIS